MAAPSCYCYLCATREKNSKNLQAHENLSWFGPSLQKSGFSNSWSKCFTAGMCWAAQKQEKVQLWIPEVAQRCLWSWQNTMESQSIRFYLPTNILTTYQQLPNWLGCVPSNECPPHEPVYSWRVTLLPKRHKVRAIHGLQQADRLNWIPSAEFGSEARKDMRTVLDQWNRMLFVYRCALIATSGETQFGRNCAHKSAMFHRLSRYEVSANPPLHYSQLCHRNEGWSAEFPGNEYCELYNASGCACVMNLQIWKQATCWEPVTSQTHSTMSKYSTNFLV